MRLRDRLKWWFFREELTAWSKFKREQQAFFVQSIENDVSAARDQYAYVAKTNEDLERILALLEPHTVKIHAPNPQPQDWETVLRKNAMAEIEGA